MIPVYICIDIVGCVGFSILCISKKNITVVSSNCVNMGLSKRLNSIESD